MAVVIAIVFVADGERILIRDDCDFVARDEQEILRQCADHPRSARNMKEIPAEFAAQVCAAIRDEAA
jgi:predicted small metal-binding protein